jgi:HEAT repeat protein
MLPTDNAGLVNYLRLRARGEPAKGTLRQLIDTLHSKTPAARQQACADLVAIGTPAVPLLRDVACEPDAPAPLLARRCLKAIKADGGTLTIAAIGLFAKRRPADMAGVLMDYLPHAENESVLGALTDALTEVAYDAKGAADPSVVKALSDKHPLRRATAVTAMAQGNWTRYQSEVRKLLLDPAPSVRLRAALVLAEGGDVEAITALISLLGEIADEPTREQIEDLLNDLAGELAPKVRPGIDKKTRLLERDAWAKWWGDTAKTGLLDELKKRTVSDDAADKARGLIAKLADEDFDVRQKAQKDLIQLGVVILPLLKREAKTNSDAEVRSGVSRCVATIEELKEKEKSADLMPTIARLIAMRKPPGAAEAILAYLPLVDDDELFDALQEALNAVAFSKGKAQPAILKALTDKSALRRAAAATSLCAESPADHVELVRTLLKDPEPSVRLKAALALARARDAAGVPTLISLVAEPQLKVAQPAEEYLNKLASATKPKDLPAGEGSDARKKRCKAWSVWWEANKSKVAMIAPNDRPRRAAAKRVRGYTLLVLTDQNTITELGADGKPLWTVTGLKRPVDVEVLPGRGVLVAERFQVTERTFKGQILWQKEVPQPCNVQRLRNGNTFIACADRLIEVNRAGVEVLKIPVQEGGVASARKLQNGKFAAYAHGQLIQFDRKGRQLKTVGTPSGAGCIEVLDNGHIISAFPGAGECIEYDTDGKEVGRLNVAGASHGFRLRNGHTLVNIEGRKFLELDKNWKQIKQTDLKAPASRVKGR